MHLDTDLKVIWKRGIQRGISSLQRERNWSTTLGVLVGTFLLFQLVLIVQLGGEGVRSLLQSRTDIRLEILDEASNQQIGEFFAALQQVEYIDDTAYISKEQAYERAEQYDSELTAFLEEFSMGNPFPDTIGVTLKSLDDYAVFKRFVEQEQWNGIVDPGFLTSVTDQEKQIEQLLHFTEAGKSLALVLLIVVGALLVFITMELVHFRVLSRENEVLIEKLVGASPLTLFIPFATEAALLLFASAIISFILSCVLVLLLPGIIPGLQYGGILSALRSEISPLLSTTLPQYFLLETLLIPLVAVGGTWFGMRRELLSRTLSLHTV